MMSRGKGMSSRLSLLAISFTACCFTPYFRTCEASRAILWGEVYIPSVLSSKSGETKPQRPSTPPAPSSDVAEADEGAYPDLEQTQAEVENYEEVQKEIARRKARAWMNINQAGPRPKRRPPSDAPRYQWKEPEALKDVRFVSRERRSGSADPTEPTREEEGEKEEADDLPIATADHEDSDQPEAQDEFASLKNLEDQIDDEKATKVTFKSLLDEYRRTPKHVDKASGQVTRVGDLHSTHYALYKMAPDSKREYFKHVDQLAYVGVPRGQLAAPRTKYDEDGNEIHPHTVPLLDEEQKRQLPRSTREFIKHQEKAVTHPDRVARWEALNRKAAAKGWLHANERARSRGFNINDSVTRRVITGSK